MSWPYYDEETIRLVANVLRSGQVNYWTGNLTKQFESAFAQHMGATHGIALCNGTVSLEVALKAMGIGPGDEVIVSPRSFIASVSCVLTVGATPIFVDVDLESQNMDPKSIKKAITPNTKAIIPVHLAGEPCEMDEIMAIANEHKLYVLEDCAQAHGAKYKGKYVGSIGHVGSFSFCQDKIISTGGEGGAVITSHTDLYEKMWSLKDHGKKKSKLDRLQLGSEFKWLHDSLGTNYRMTEMQAAIGLRQLSLLEEWVDKRNILARCFIKNLKGQPGIKLIEPKPHIRHAYYRFYCFLDKEVFPKIREAKKQILDSMNEYQIPCFFGSCPEIYKEQAFHKKEFLPSHSLSNAMLLGDTSLMFLVHPTLSENHIKKVCEKFREIINKILASS